DGERRGAEGLAGARQRRVGARDRAARGRPGGRVPRAARAGARCRGRALLRPVAVPSAGRGSVARRRDRRGRRVDPRRVVPRGGRGGGGSAPVRRLRWDSPRAMPKHPYRDSAILYAFLAGLVVAITALSGGAVVNSLIIAGALFVASTAYSWWRWRERAR